MKTTGGRQTLSGQHRNSCYPRCVYSLPENGSWRSAPLDRKADGAQTQKLENLGFARQTGWAGIQTILVPNSVDEESPFTDLRLREAMEYAINKDEICVTLGFGYLEPLFTIAPQDDVGGDKVFREYNPDKAKQLLAEAGYPNGGLKVKLLAQVATGGRNDLAEMLKVYLDEVGFEVELDMVDSVAASAAMFGQDGPSLHRNRSGC